MMPWEDRVGEKKPVFAGRCEWCALVLDGFEGVKVFMPRSGNAVTTAMDWRRFCDEACAKQYDAIEEQDARHPQCDAPEVHDEDAPQPAVEQRDGDESTDGG